MTKACCEIENILIDSVYQWLDDDSVCHCHGAEMRT